MRSFKKIGLVILIILTLLMLLAVWYRMEYSMDTADAFEMNSPVQDHRLLIVTQGSDFKDKVTRAITDYYKEKPVFVKVIDIKSLPDINPDTFDALVIMHTWEYSRPPKEVKSFVEHFQDIEEKLIILSTSGEGSQKMKGMDAITGESILENAQEYSNKIITEVESIFSVSQ